MSKGQTQSAKCWQLLCRDPLHGICGLGYRDLTLLIAKVLVPCSPGKPQRQAQQTARVHEESFAALTYSKCPTF